MNRKQKQSICFVIILLVIALIAVYRVEIYDVLVTLLAFI